jgi:hypothetical protein
MGACYSVLCKLKFDSKNEQKVLEKMQERYRKDLREGVGFCLSKYDFGKPETVEQFMALYFTKHQSMYSSGVEVLKNGNIVYTADSGFDASYGWHRLMLDFFESVAEYLMRGSILKIYDDDCVTYRVKEGKVY